MKQKDRNFIPAIDIFMQKKKKSSGELHLVELSYGSLNTFMLGARQINSSGFFVLVKEKKRIKKITTY